ncbi:MAG: phytanoyl-CoA dioxygenase family protein [Acidobacteriota bacterium]|nr:phytanoyl-CoA dioxygenase family protein [Acidobacteriota bacterium]
MKLTVEQIALLPAARDVAFYREHGYWVSPPCLSADEIEAGRFGAERYYAGERDSPLGIDTGTDWTEEDGEVLRQNDYVTLQIDELRELGHHPLLAAMAARLCGSGEVRLFHDQLIYKPAGAAPGDSIVGWHTDRAYWGTCSSDSMLTAWIPFQDLTPEMGPLAVIDGSHLWTGNDHLRTFHNPDLQALEALIRRGPTPGEVVPLTMQRGQVSFHHCRTIHASFPNTSATPRLAFAIHMQDGANHYQKSYDASGKLVTHINDILCTRDATGDPDYRDPAICPVLWSGELPPLA